MYSTVFVLFAAAVLLNDVSGHGATSHMETKNAELPKDYKRHTDTIRCVNDKLDDAFSGDNSALASNCRDSAEELLDFTDTYYSQSEITSVFRTFCNPKCGNVIIDAFNDCEYSEHIEISGLENFFIGLCGTNQNGDTCYEIYRDAIDHLSTEQNCYTYYSQCYCRSELLEGVGEQGCCLNAYHNYKYSRPVAVYQTCNVDLPTGCNNSPVTAEGARGHGVMPQVALVTLISVLIFSVLIG